MGDWKYYIPHLECDFLIFFNNMQNWKEACIHPVQTPIEWETKDLRRRKEEPLGPIPTHGLLDT